MSDDLRHRDADSTGPSDLCSITDFGQHPHSILTLGSRERELASTVVTGLWSKLAMKQCHSGTDVIWSEASTYKSNVEAQL